MQAVTSSAPPQRMMAARNRNSRAVDIIVLVCWVSLGFCLAVLGFCLGWVAGSLGWVAGSLDPCGFESDPSP